MGRDRLLRLPLNAIALHVTEAAGAITSARFNHRECLPSLVIVFRHAWNIWWGG